MYTLVVYYEKSLLVVIQCEHHEFADRVLDNYAKWGDWDRTKLTGYWSSAVEYNTIKGSLYEQA